MSPRVLFLLLAGLGLAGFGLSAEAQPASILEGGSIVRRLTDLFFSTALATAVDLVPESEWLAGILAVIGYVIWLIRHPDLSLERLLGGAAWRFVVVGVVITSVRAYESLATRDWLTPVGIVTGLEALGKGAAGTADGLDPGAPLLHAVQATFTLFEAVFELGFWEAVGYSMISVVVAVILLLGYLLVSVAILVAVAQASLVIAAGPLLVSVGTWEQTASLTEGYLRLACSAGLRVFATYLLMGFGDQLSLGLAQEIQFAAQYGNGDDLIGTGLLMGLVAVLFGVLVLVVPQTLASVGRDWRFDLVGYLAGPGRG